ncbi:hypothetical protein RhiirB3_471169 [Rhizophagus irregularis]|nr:hypothetical protein RhiirB3_471169 [Rhizophagus irregularis]
MGQMKGLGLALHSLDTTREWEVHITNIFFKDWIDYYQITHILATMNSLASLMDVEIWNRGQKLDERHLKIIEIQDFSAVPYTKQDKSQVKRQLFAINRKEKRNQKNKEDNNSLKRKYGQSKIQPIDENNYELKSDNSRSFRA